MHLEDERLQRLIDGELAAAELAAVRAHLGECAACRDRATVSERELTELHERFRLLDHTMPAVSAHDFVRARHTGWGIGRRWAAGLLLAAGLAGVAYAAPGSPVRGWVLALAGSLRPAEESNLQSPAHQAELAGISLPPGQRLLVTFDSAQAEGEAVITLRADAAEVAVRGPAGAAAFGAGVDHITIANAGSRASFAIEIPANAPRVEVRVAGKTVFLKDGRRVTAGTGADTTSGSYRIPLGP